MPITVKHSKTSAIPDAGDANLVQPSDWNADHTLTGLGTMAEQNANAVAITGGTISGATITGGSINGATVGASTPSTGAFTTLSGTGQLTLTNASNYNLYASGAGANYMAGGLGIGSATASADVPLTVNLVGTGVNTNGIRASQTIPATSTSTHKLFQSIASTAASAFTLTTLNHYEAFQSTIGAGSAVTNQNGFIVQSNLSGATNNYGFRGVLAAATGRYNLYMSGTADNYLAGSLGIGAVPVAGTNIKLAKNITGATTAYGFTNQGAVQSDVTTGVTLNYSGLSTAAAAFTLSTATHYSATQESFGAGSAVTTQTAFLANAFSGATNNYGFYGNIAAATGRFNLYMAGTAANYLAGKLGIGGVPSSANNLRIAGSATGGTTQYGVINELVAASDVTGTLTGFTTSLSTAAAAFTITEFRHFNAGFNTIGAGSTLTNQYAYYASAGLTGATNNYAFHGNLAAASGRFNLYMAGTAANYFAGDMQFNKTVTAAGTTGAQTISKNAGTVNFAAAATSLVVTNTLVTANSIIICTVGTNDTTMKSASAVAGSGSFTIHANAAATAETRVNFIVIN